MQQYQRNAVSLPVGFYILYKQVANQKLFLLVFLWCETI